MAICSGFPTAPTSVRCERRVKMASRCGAATRSHKFYGQATYERFRFTGTCGRERRARHRALPHCAGGERDGAGRAQSPDRMLDNRDGTPESDVEDGVHVPEVGLGQRPGEVYLIALVAASSGGGETTSRTTGTNCGRRPHHEVRTGESDWPSDSRAVSATKRTLDRRRKPRTPFGRIPPGSGSERWRALSLTASPGLKDAVDAIGLGGMRS